MSEFTQGKWTYDPINGIVHDDGKLIAEVAGAGGSNYRHARGEANARLIAFAPEMYELLKEELIPTSDYGGILSFSREDKLKKLFARIDGKEDENDNHE